METSKLQDHPSRSPLADKIIRSKTQISPPNHPITSHQFQSLGTCQESETQLAHYMSFSSGCPPRALIFVRTPECHDTPEIYICHNNLTEKLEQSSGYPMLSDFKNSHPRTWPNSSHLVHFSSHKIYTTPQFSVYIDAKGRQSSPIWGVLAAPRQGPRWWKAPHLDFHRFTVCEKYQEAIIVGFLSTLPSLLKGCPPQKIWSIDSSCTGYLPLLNSNFLNLGLTLSTMHINDNC